MELSGAVVAITGAGSGIGRSLALKFAAEGAKAVICTDRDGPEVEETAAMVEAAYGQGEHAVTAVAAILDVSDERAIEDLVAQTVDRFGTLDVFVSNAGYGLRGGLELPTDEWLEMMTVHTWSHLAAARAVIPGMIDRGGGYLLNTASAAGLLTQMDSGPYAVSKHAAVALAEWLAITYGDDGIGVSVLCPQAVRTNIIAKAKRNPTVAGASNSGSSASSSAPKGRQAAGDGVLEPDDVADSCLDAIKEGRFLVLPHPEVETYFQRKAGDYDRWLRGMRKFRARLSAQ